VMPAFVLLRLPLDYGVPCELPPSDFPPPAFSFA